MSLALVALRLAAVEALRTHPVIAAACPGRVFDSRMSDFESTDPVPTIVVTTEELTGEPWNSQNGGAPFNEECDLCMEIAMTQFQSEDGEIFLFRPETDKEQEASLNLISECADWILTLGRPTPRTRPTAAGMLLHRAVIRRVSKRTVTRFASDQTGEKLAIHLVTYRVEVMGEEIDMRDPPTGDFAVLPDPLRTVARSLPAGSSGQLTCQMIETELARVSAVTSTLSQVVVAPPPDPNAQVPGTLPLDLVIDTSQGT